MDMDLHLAMVQQRWRYASDELAPGESLRVDALAHDVSLLPDGWEGPPDQTAEALLDFFSQGLAASATAPGDGGSIEPADEVGSEADTPASAVPADVEPPQFESTGENP
jgi:type IV secretion system protein VirD4